jgi:uncharacterized membrane protein
VQTINQNSGFSVSLWAGALASVVMIYAKTFGPGAMLATSAPADIHRSRCSKVKAVVVIAATTRSVAGWQSNGEKLSRHPA